MMHRLLIGLLPLLLLACADEAKPAKTLEVSPGGNESVTPADAGRPRDPEDPENPREPEGPPEDPEAPATEPPEPVVLTITQPPRGARAFGSTIEVEGVVEGGVAPHVTVGGRRVVQDAAGRFSATVDVAPGLIILESTVVDDTGDLEDRRAVLVDGDSDPAAAIDHGAGAYVSRAGFTAVSALLTDYLSDLDLSALVAGNVPEGITINSISYDRIEVQLVPLRGLIEARLRVHGLYVELEGEVSFGISFTIGGSATADPAEIVAQLSVAADGRGGLDIDIEGGEVNLHGFDYDINYVPDFVEDWFSGRVQEFAQGLLVDALTGFVVPSLFDPAALERTIDLFGTSIALGLRIDAVSVDPEGLTVDMDGRATADQVVREGNGVPLLGGLPTYDKSGHLDLALAADLIARILHAAWAGGALDITLGDGGDFELPVPLSAAILVPALGPAGQGLDPRAALTVRMRPLLPPEVRVIPGENPLVIEFGDLLFDIESSTDGPLVTVAADLVAHASVRVTGLDAIELGADLEVEVHADVAERPRGPVNDARLEQLLEGLAGAIPGLLAEQTFTFGADVLPVPVRFTNPRFEADSRAEFVHIRAQISGP